MGVRAGGKAVPAPQIALATDQPLALPQLGLTIGAIAAFDEADLVETAMQRRRRHDECPKRRDAIPQT